MERMSPIRFSVLIALSPLLTRYAADLVPRPATPLAASGSVATQSLSTAFTISPNSAKIATVSRMYARSAITWFLVGCREEPPAQAGPRRSGPVVEAGHGVPRRGDRRGTGLVEVRPDRIR